MRNRVTLRSLLLPLLVLVASACAEEDTGPKVRWEARSRPTGFELSRNGAAFEPFWPIGVNFGLALPGHSPGEFLASQAMIAEWLEVTRAAGGNCVRTYTVQSPEFYRALRDYNMAHQSDPIFLMQGAWIKEPEGFGPDYLSTESNTWIRDEIDKVVDVVHGDREIPHGSVDRPMNWGRAFGTFDADVSPWLLGYLFGRELEPYTIESTLAKHPDSKTSVTGKYLSIVGDNAIEAWIVEHMDRIVARERSRYGQQHPIGFSNWPTLDPIPHWTEPKIPVSAEDTYQVDLEPIQTAADFTAGVFMSYHAYPYYPDFILYQPEYQGFSDDQGTFSYLGYLDALRQHHKDHAVIVAEIGHPSSFGNGHQSPSGQDHGGMSEQTQGPAVVRSVAAIADAGLDGAMVFALLDEWFKRAWVVERVEQPTDRRRMWHNIMNPEQNFGLIATDAGPAVGHHVLDAVAAADEWKTADGPDTTFRAATAGSARPLSDGHDGERRLQSLTVEHDATYLHVLVRLEPSASGKIDWSRLDLLLVFDTIDPDRGDGRLDPAGKVTVGRRVEHVLRIHGPNDAQLLVDKPFDLYGLWHGFREPWQKYRSTTNDAGEFNLVRTITNAAYEVQDEKTGKWTELGSMKVQETGRFVIGKELDDSLAMVAIDAATGTIEVRVPWNLLHFTDPSSLQIVDDDGSAGSKKVTTGTTDGVAVAVVLLGGKDEAETTLVDSIPAASQTSTGHALPATGWAHHTWKVWDEPAWHQRHKPIIARLGAELPGRLPASIKPPAP
ncbi:MAG: hypothetical protein RIT45_1401 [Pseudomonadota bacterium]|jgi:hypothetical protein